MTPRQNQRSVEINTIRSSDYTSKDTEKATYEHWRILDGHELASPQPKYGNCNGPILCTSIMRPKEIMNDQSSRFTLFSVPKSPIYAESSSPHLQQPSLLPTLASGVITMPAVRLVCFLGSLTAISLKI